MNNHPGSTGFRLQQIEERLSLARTYLRAETTSDDISAGFQVRLARNWLDCCVDAPQHAAAIAGVRDTLEDIRSELQQRLGVDPLQAERWRSDNRHALGEVPDYALSQVVLQPKMKRGRVGVTPPRPHEYFEM